jgi:hypothetical protein
MLYMFMIMVYSIIDQINALKPYREVLFANIKTLLLISKMIIEMHM